MSKITTTTATTTTGLVWSDAAQAELDALGRKRGAMEVSKRNWLSAAKAIIDGTDKLAGAEDRLLITCADMHGITAKHGQSGKVEWVRLAGLVGIPEGTAGQKWSHLAGVVRRGGLSLAVIRDRVEGGESIRKMYDALPKAPKANKAPKADNKAPKAPKVTRTTAQALAAQILADLERLNTMLHSRAKVTPASMDALATATAKVINASGHAGHVLSAQDKAAKASLKG